MQKEEECNEVINNRDDTVRQLEILENRHEKLSREKMKMADDSDKHILKAAKEFTETILKKDYEFGKASEEKEKAVRELKMLAAKYEKEEEQKQDSKVL